MDKRKQCPYNKRVMEDKETNKIAMEGLKGHESLLLKLLKRVQAIEPRAIVATTETFRTQG
jgi:hypothetical protein